MSKIRSTAAGLAGALLAFAASTGTGSAQQPLLGADTLSQLRYRYIGPVGNRVTSAAGIPGQPNVYYVEKDVHAVLKGAPPAEPIAARRRACQRRAAFNAMLKEKGIPNVVTRVPAGPGTR